MSDPSEFVPEIKHFAESYTSLRCSSFYAWWQDDRPDYIRIEDSKGVVGVVQRKDLIKLVEFIKIEEAAR